MNLQLVGCTEMLRLGKDRLKAFWLQGMGFGVVLWDRTKLKLAMPREANAWPYFKNDPTFELIIHAISTSLGRPAPIGYADE